MTSSEPSELTATKRNGTTTTTASTASTTTNQLKSDDKQYNKNALMKFKSYLIALRVWSLSASIIPTILGR